MLNPKGIQMMTSKEAADYLGYAENTLREARVRGNLAGVEAPPYVKMGRKIHYDKTDLDAWKSQFRKITNTAQPSTNSFSEV